MGVRTRQIQRDRSGNGAQRQEEMGAPPLGVFQVLRQSFHEWAGHSIAQSVWARAYYCRQRERGKGHHAAVRSLAFKFIASCFAAGKIVWPMTRPDISWPWPSASESLDPTHASLRSTTPDHDYHFELLFLGRFYQNLVLRGKVRLQAVVAVMRKLLHALFAMFRTNRPYDASNLCALSPIDKAIAVCA
jgi:hypothetical protein